MTELSGSFFCFHLGTDTSGAEMEFLALPFYGDSSCMYVGHPLAFGMALGMADIAAPDWTFSTKVALHD